MLSHRVADVKPYFTVGNLKSLIEKANSALDRNFQRLYYNGVLLEDDETLESHNMKHKSVLSVTLVTGEQIRYVQPRWFP